MSSACQDRAPRSLCPAPHTQINPCMALAGPGTPGLGPGHLCYPCPVMYMLGSDSEALCCSCQAPSIGIGPWGLLCPCPGPHARIRPCANLSTYSSTQACAIWPMGLSRDPYIWKQVGGGTAPLLPNFQICGGVLWAK